MNRSAKASVIAPVLLDIIPKPAPILLKLDSEGQFNIHLADVARIDYDTTYTLTTSISPQQLTCADLGLTTINVTAQLSKATPTAMSFRTSSFILVRPNGDLILADTQNDELRYIKRTGEVTTMAAGDGSPYSDNSGIQQKIKSPNGLAIDGNGNLYIVETSLNDIVKLTPEGQLTKIRVNNPELLEQAYGLAVDPLGNLYVSEREKRQIIKIDVNGEASIFADRSQNLNAPSGMTLGKDGNLYVADAVAQCIWQITSSGVTKKLLFPQLGKAQSVQMDDDGNYYIAESDNHTVKKYNSSFNFVTKLANEKDGLSKPISLGIDALGETFVLNFENDVISKIDDKGKVSTYAGGVPGNKNGNIAPIVEAPVNKSIPVTVVGTLKFTTPLIDHTLNAPSICSIIMPDYRLQAIVTDYCGKQVSLTQTPAAGTLITDDKPVAVIITATDEFKSIVRDTFIVATHFPTTAMITFPSNLVVKPGNSVQLEPDFISANIRNYEWSPDITLSATDISNPLATPKETTIYHLKFTTTDGCSDNVDVKVTVLRLGTIPNTFTPNGDGVNDTWNIPGLADFPGCQVNIFNRYGVIIYYSKNYTEPWNGQFNGMALPSGTYYYIISPGNELPFYSGSITIIR